MRKLLIFSGFVLGNFSILIIALIIFTIYSTRGGNAAEITAQQSTPVGNSDPSIYQVTLPTVSQPTSIVIAKDARPVIVDIFFKRYSSPMTGLGGKIVQAADKYQIPFGFLPAIAQCEGNLGKSMPNQSYNPYGFGMYGSKITRFSSWEEGIELVSKTLRTDYLNIGLDTPEKIMAKYTPPSEGSWARCVNQYLAELQ